MTLPPEPPDGPPDDDRPLFETLEPDDRQQAPVIFVGDGEESGTQTFAEYNDSGVMRVFGVVVLLAVVIAVLVLPPISLLDRGGSDSGGISAHREGELPELPDDLTALSGLFRLEISDQLSETSGPWTLAIKLNEQTLDPRNVGLYTFGSAGWVRVDRARLTDDGNFAEADLTEIPATVAVLRRTAVERTLSLIIPVDQGLDPEALAGATRLVVMAGALRRGDDGAARLTTSPGVERYSGDLTLQMPVYLGVTLAPDAADQLRDLLSTEPALVAHAGELAAEAARIDADGIYLAYLDVDEDRQGGFTRLATLLAERLGEENRGLIVGVPVPAAGNAGGYDWAALLDVSTALWLNAPDDPAAYYERLEAVFAARQAGGLDLNSVSLVLDRMSRLSEPTGFRSIDRWDALGRAAVLESQGGGIEVGDVVELTATNLDLNRDGSGLRWDLSAQALSFTYSGDDGPHTVWIENHFSLAYRLDLVQRFELGGVAVASAWASEQLPAFWPTLGDFVKTDDLELSRPYGPYLNPCWRVTDGLLEDQAGNCWAPESEPITRADWRAPETPGAYEVRLIVSDGEAFIGRQLTLRVVAEGELPTPTPTPTAEPTETPTPEPTPTPESTETPTPEATETPTPEATETPTPEATETPTPEATETPTPEATETPAPEATETPAPEATETPTPEATETPAPEVTETPAPVVTETPTAEATSGPPGPGGNQGG